MPSAKIVEQVMTRLQMIWEIDPDSLRQTTLIESNEKKDFDPLVPYLLSMQEMTAAITPELVREVPDTIVNQIRSPLDEFAPGIQAAAQFKAGSYGNPQHERDQLIQKVRESYAQLAPQMRIIGDLATAAVPPSERPELAELRSTIDELKGAATEAAANLAENLERGHSIRKAVEQRSEELDQLFETAKKDLETSAERREAQVQELIEGLEVEIEERLEATRKAISEIAVSQEARHFDIEAARHAVAAWWWLGWTVLSVGIFLVVAVPGAFEYVVSTTSPSTFAALVAAPTSGQGVFGVPLPYLLSKLVTLGAISFLIGICAKNFLSHRHNTVLNRHRVNALMTFEALAKSAVSDTSRDVILHHAASCIFNPQDTGFGKVGEAGPGINIVEAVQRAVDSPRAGSPSNR